MAKILLFSFKDDNNGAFVPQSRWGQGLSSPSVPMLFRHVYLNPMTGARIEILKKIGRRPWKRASLQIHGLLLLKTQLEAQGDPSFWIGTVGPVPANLVQHVENADGQP